MFTGRFHNRFVFDSINTGFHRQEILDNAITSVGDAFGLSLVRISDRTGGSAWGIALGGSRSGLSVRFD